MQKKYDIFISYRRVGGKEYARTIKPELEKRGFHVFLDFDELDDGKFDQRIMDAIKASPVFLLILSKGALDRCRNIDDWVRQEILFAEEAGCHVVPVEFDKTFRTMPADTPDDISRIIGAHSWAQIDTENLLRESVDKMVERRIRPYVGTAEPPKTATPTGTEIHIETDADCDLYRFREHLATLHAGEDNVVLLKPGNYKLEFVSTAYPDIKTSKVYSLSPDLTADFFEVSLKDRVEARMKEEAEAKRKAEEEARRKAEEEARRKAEEGARRKAEEEEKRRLEESIKEHLRKLFESAEETRQKAEEEAQQTVVHGKPEDVKRKAKDAKLTPIQKDKLYGYADEHGQIVIPCQWKAAYPFSADGLAKVVDSHWKCGYIDKTGRLVIPHQWDSADDFSEGFARVSEGFYSGYIDTTGKMVIPSLFKYAKSFSEGLACVSKSQKYGYIDKTGGVVIPCEWKEARSFHQGMAAVMDEADKWGFINKSGKNVIPCKYEKVSDFSFSDGRAEVVEKNWLRTKTYFIDKTGRLIE